MEQRYIHRWEQTPPMYTSLTNPESSPWNQVTLSWLMIKGVQYQLRRSKISGGKEGRNSFHLPACSVFRFPLWASQLRWNARLTPSALLLPPCQEKKARATNLNCTLTSPELYFHPFQKSIWKLFVQEEGGVKRAKECKHRGENEIKRAPWSYCNESG